MPLKNYLSSETEDAIINDLEEQISRMEHILKRHIDGKRVSIPSKPHCIIEKEVKSHYRTLPLFLFLYVVKW